MGQVLNGHLYTSSQKNKADKFKSLQTTCTSICYSIARLRKLAHQHQVPPQLVINWEPTGLNVVPALTSTINSIEEEGSTNVSIIGLGQGTNNCNCGCINE